MPSVRVLTITAGLAIVGASTQADIIVYDFHMSACKEVPPSGTTGFGEATVTLDTDTGDVSVTGTYQAMSTDVINAHIHGLADVDNNAGVIVQLQFDGGTEGGISGTGVLDAAEIQGMLDGLTYINIHTVMFGPGEIRGQVVQECRGDFNGDGAKNILDFVDYQNAFLKQECEADLNHDLLFNILDFVEFQGVFQEACP